MVEMIFKSFLKGILMGIYAALDGFALWVAHRAYGGGYYLLSAMAVSVFVYSVHLSLKALDKLD